MKSNNISLRERMAHSTLLPLNFNDTLFDQNNIDKDRLAVIKMFESDHNKYAFTVTFLAGTSDRKVIESFSFLMKLLNKKLYGKRYLKNNAFIDGFVGIERCISNTLHFHCIIRDKNNALEKNMTFAQAVCESIPKIVKTNSKRRLISDSGYDIQVYYNNGNSGFEKYITKNMSKVHFKQYDKLYAPLDYDMRTQLNFLL